MMLPADIQAVIFDGAGPIMRPLVQWAAAFPGLWLASEVLPGFADVPRGPVSNTGFVARMRNLAWHLFLETPSRPWLLMVDDDQIPVAETAPLFSQPYPHPIMAARYFAKNGAEAHPEDGYVGCGCLLVSRVAAEMIGPDPFTVTTGEGCECVAFCRRAHAAGFWPKKVGAIGHRCMVDVLPSGECDYRIRFPTAAALSRHGGNANTGVLPPGEPVGLQLGGGVV